MLDGDVFDADVLCDAEHSVLATSSMSASNNRNIDGSSEPWGAAAPVFGAWRCWLKCIDSNADC